MIHAIHQANVTCSSCLSRLARFGYGCQTEKYSQSSTCFGSGRGFGIVRSGKRKYEDELRGELRRYETVEQMMEDNDEASRCDMYDALLTLCADAPVLFRSTTVLSTPFNI